MYKIFPRQRRVSGNRSFPEFQSELYDCFKYFSTFPMRLYMAQNCTLLPKTVYEDLCKNYYTSNHFYDRPYCSPTKKAFFYFIPYDGSYIEIPGTRIMFAGALVKYKTSFFSCKLNYFL